MYVYNILGQYSLAVMAGIVCILLVIMQGREKLKAKKKYLSVILFVCSIVGISLVMYASYSNETILDNPHTSAFFRALDYGLYGLLLFAWLNLLCQLRSEKTLVRHFDVYRAGKAISLFSLGVFFIISVFFMDSFYYISNDGIQTFYHWFEIIYALIAALISMIAAFKAVPDILISINRKFAILTSVVISLYFIFQIYLTRNIGLDVDVSWGKEPQDVSGWLLFAINVFTAYFIFKNDFQREYIREKENNEKDPIEKALNTVSETHHLTLREREILEHVYKGETNAVIAETLYISLNTVKTHLRRIFEKIGVSSRMELVYLVNEQIYNSKESPGN